MRLTETLQTIKPLKKFTNYRARDVFRQTFQPMALKNEVPAKGEKKKERICNQEMSMMLVCLERHEFNEALCSKEVKTFWQCQQTAQASRQSKLDAEAKGILTKSAGKFPSKFINKLLQQYPQPKK